MPVNFSVSMRSNIAWPLAENRISKYRRKSLSYQSIFPLRRNSGSSHIDILLVFRRWADNFSLKWGRRLQVKHIAGFFRSNIFTDAWGVSKKLLISHQIIYARSVKMQRNHFIQNFFLQQRLVKTETNNSTPKIFGNLFHCFNLSTFTSIQQSFKPFHGFGSFSCQLVPANIIGSYC